MQFIIKAYDGAGKLEKRMEVRPRHLEGMQKLGNHLICAGGLLDDEGKMMGSTLIMDFDSRKELDDYIIGSVNKDKIYDIFARKYEIMKDYMAGKKTICNTCFWNA